MPTVLELKSALRKRNLPTDALKAELETRLETARSDEFKRTKTAINGIAEEYVCPITQGCLSTSDCGGRQDLQKKAITRWLNSHQRSRSGWRWA